LNIKLLFTPYVITPRQRFKGDITVFNVSFIHLFVLKVEDSNLKIDVG